MTAVAAPGLREQHRALVRCLRLLDLRRGRLAWAVTAGSLGLGSAVALIAASGWLIARASQMPPVLDLSVAVVSVRAFGISRALFRYLERLASHDVALSGMGALRERLYSTLAAGRADAVVGLRRGDVLTRTGADVDAVGDLVVRALLPAAVTAVVGLGSVVLVAVFLPAAAVVLAACLLGAGVLSPWLTARAARRAEVALADERAELSATALTLVDSAGELQVSGRTTTLLAAVSRTDARLAVQADRAARPAAWAAALNLAAMGAAVVGALLLGVPATTAGTLAAVELAVVVLVPLAAFEATSMLPAAAVQLVRSGAAAVRVTALLDAAQPDGTPSAGSPSVGVAEASGAPSTLGARGVACGWPAGPVVLEGVDVELRPGRAVAVVGASGVGKTTLLLTLAGLLEPRAGSVRVGGRDPWPLDRATVSETVVLTAEDAHVFDTTVLENLRVARGDVTPDEARAALVAAGLGPWLAGLPDGVETRLSTDATTVSGGERRRLLLARALLSPAPVLLLDEPAEHLDAAAADALVTDLLETGRGDRGVLLVTHRLSALGAADEVLVLGHDGDSLADADAPPATGGPGAGPARVVARGTHADLVARLPAYAWALAQEDTGVVDVGPSARPTVLPPDVRTDQR